MKKTVIVLIFVLAGKVAFGQQNLLSFDEHNKYIYYQVVNMPGISADSLHERGSFFFKTAYPKTVVKTTGTDALQGEGKFITYGGFSVTRHEQEEINYQK